MAHSQQRERERPQYGVDLFRLHSGGRTIMGSYPTENAAIRMARLDWHNVGGCRYVLIDRGSGLSLEGYTVRAGGVTDFVVTHPWGGMPDPEPPGLAMNVPPMAARQAFLKARMVEIYERRRKAA